MQSQQHPQQIPLNHVHEALGAKMTDFAGFWMPVRYSSDKAEHACVREGVGVFDVSHMGEFLLKGEKALELIQLVTSNDASKLTDGKAQYSCLPNQNGGIVDDLLVYKMKDNEYMLVVNASNIEKDWNWISQFNNLGVEMQNISNDICLFAVQGPKATETLQTLTSVNLAEIPYYSFATDTIGGVENVIISATGYTGAGGFELYVHKKDAETLWNKIFEAGKIHNIQPIGLGARDTLRLEMGYCLYGNDIDDTTSPIEAGLGWITKFTKNFTNSENIKKQKEQGVSKKLVGFEMTDKGIARGHYEIQNEKGEKIGEVTSGTISPTLNIGVGMGYVNTEYAQEGTEIFINIRNKAHKAKVAKIPFLKK
jgi:aminomethyltransferase